MTIKLVDATLVHPGTGLAALFLSEDGRPVFPHRGADGEGDDGDGGNDDDADDEDESEDDGEDEDADDKGDDDKAKKKKGKRVIDPDDYDAEVAHKERIRKQLAASDKKRAAAEKELNELKKKDLPDGDKIKAELAEITEERDGLRTRFENLARTNAFLTASAQADINWHDPDDAMAAARRDLQDLEISEEGAVDGMSDLVKDLAKRKPHLVRKEVKSDDGEDDDDKKAKTNGRRSGASGSGVGSRSGKRQGQKGKLSDEELMRRFPALRR